MLKPMFAYQGGKTKIADKIVSEILKTHGDSITFVDVCCGGGSVSIEIINRGLHPENVNMFDVGAIGVFWQQVSEGSFDLDYFEYIINKIPKDLDQVKPMKLVLSEVEVSISGDYS